MVPGGPPLEFAMHNTVTADNRTLQVIVRGSKNSEAATMATATAIWNLIRFVSSQTANGTVYKKVMARGAPFFVGPDPKERPMVSMNFDVTS